MENEVKSILICYKNIKLGMITANNIDYGTIKKILDENFRIKVSIPNFLSPENIMININELCGLDSEFLGGKFIDYLSEDKKRIVKYLDLMEHLSLNSFPFVDKTLNVNNRIIPTSYTYIISNRNERILKDLFTNYFNKNIYICFYLLRDLIENIKMHLYFLKGPILIKKTGNGNTQFEEEIDMNEQRKIIDSLEKGTKWNPKIDSLIDKVDYLNLWRNEFEDLINIERKCNNYVHKNGLDKIFPNVNIDGFSIDDVFKVIKFFFTMVISFDGKSICSSNYTDYLDMGMKPIKDSQYWIASIFEDFINSEYTKEEIKKIKKYTYMKI